ncbi:MAG TPA: calcium-binding protein, partial [Methylococcales bacterium]|nr:calcium-binding protein [Methylococcales bacterium]
MWQRPAEAGVAVEGEFQVNTYTTNNQSGPSTTALNDGGFVVTWTSVYQDGSGPGIYGQRFDSAGATVGGEFKVNSFTWSSQFDSSTTALNDGGFVVTWTSEDGGYDIYGQRYDSAGVAVGGEFKVNSTTDNHQVYSSATALADGGFVVTWDSWGGQDGSGNGIYGQRYDSAGVAVGSEFQVNSYTDNNQEYSSTTGLNDGGFVVTWSSHGQDGSDWADWGIYGQRFDSEGVAVGAEFQVNTFTDNLQYGSSITGLNEGGFVVTWDSVGQDGSHSGIYGQRFDSEGVRVGAEFQVNTITIGSQAESSTTALNDGGFVVIWTSYLQDGSSTDIYGQRFDSEGIAVGSEFQVNTYTTGIQSKPSTTALSDGGFVVTWESSDSQDGSSYGVYAHRYDSDGQTADQTINGATGNDILRGGSGADTLNGGADNDKLFGEGGDDRLYGGSGDDELDGGSGADMLNGESGEDILRGGEGNDVLFGLAGNDQLFGAEDNDKLYGGSGNDELDGGDGDDRLNGGNN